MATIGELGSGTPTPDGRFDAIGGNLLTTGLSSAAASLSKELVTLGGRTTAQLAAAPTAADIALGDAVEFYDTNTPTLKYKMNAGHTAFVGTSVSDATTLAASLAAMGVTKYSQGRRIAFIGDSLVEGANLPKPFLPVGIPPFAALTPTNISTSYLITFAPLLGVPAGTGTLECDSSGRFRYTAPSDTAGSWVDCTVGGHFLLYSGNPAYMCYVVTRWTGHSGVTVAAASDNVTLSGFPSTNNWYNLTGFPAWVVAGLQSDPVEVWGFSLAGDSIADINARKERVAAFASQQGFSWDDIVLLAGANDVSSQGSVISAGLLSLVDYFTTISDRVHVLEVFPQGAAVAAASRKHIVEANRRLAEGLRTRSAKARLVQTYSVLVDAGSATGDVVVTPSAGAKFNTDGIHLMPYGGYTVANAIIASLRPFYPIRKFVNTSGADAYDVTDCPSGNWFSNGKLLGATDGTLGGSAVAPTGTSISGTGMSIAYVSAGTMLGADDNGGKFLEVTAPSGITAEVTATLNVNASAGDTVELSGEVVTRGATGGTMAGLQCNFTSAASPNTNCGPYMGQSARIIADIANSGLMRWSQRIVVPPSPGGTCPLRLRAIGGATGTGVAAFRNVVMRKVF